MVDLSSGYREYVMPSNSALHKKHLAIAISAALAGVSPMAYSACSPVVSTIIVNTTTDYSLPDGNASITSLREALADAAADTNCKSIVFDASLNNQTITIDTDAVAGKLEYPGPGSLNIIGPGSDMLTISQTGSTGIGGDLVNLSGGDIDISGLTFEGNNSASNRAFYVDGDNLIVDDIVVQNFLNGGAYINGDPGNAVSVSNSTATGNDSTGFTVESGDTTTITGVTTTNNTGRGLSISASSSNETLTVTNLTATGNMNGGLQVNISDLSTATISDSTISGNQSSFNGGGIAMDVNTNTSSATLSNLTVDNNTSSQRGGGIYIGSNGSVEIIDSTISNNTTDGTYSSSNAAATSGGGIHFANTNIDGSALILQSTISGNSTLSAGGGIYVGTRASTANININSSTITDNDAQFGGGVFANDNGADINLSHTIVSDNTASSAETLDEDVGVAVDFFNNGDTQASYAFLGVDNGLTTNVVGSTLSGGSAMLASLADNGGTTLTHLPMDGSPVLETGDPAAVAGSGGVPTLDQRGGSRIQFDFIDIGAVEVQQPPASGGSSMISPWLAGVLAAVMGLLRLRRR